VHVNHVGAWYAFRGDTCHDTRRVGATVSQVAGELRFGSRAAVQGLNGMQAMFGMFDLAALRAPFNTSHIVDWVQFGPTLPGTVQTLNNVVKINVEGTMRTLLLRCC
jgi:hypothetical protein